MLEICALYAPHIIGPNLEDIVNHLASKGWNGFVCVCSTIMVSESSFRCHITCYHRIVGEYMLLFGSDYNYLGHCDMTLLGPNQERRDDLVDSYED